MRDERWPWYALQTKQTFRLPLWSLTHVACEQRALADTYFSSVMISLWPVYCHARRRARSLASELRFKKRRGGQGSL